MNKEAQNLWDPTSDDMPEGRDPMDDSILVSLIKRDINNCKPKRDVLAKDWFRAELFYNGIQWIKFDDKGKVWRDQRFKKKIPTPVTNVYANYADIFASLLASVPIEVTYRPSSRANPLDQTRVKTANDMVDALKQAVKFNEKQRIAAPLLSRQGEVFLIPRMVAGSANQFIEKQPRVAALEPEKILSEFVEGGEVGSSLRDGIPLTEGMSGLANRTLNPQEDILHEQGETIAEEQTEDLPGLPKLVVDVASTFECYMDEEADSLQESAFFARIKSYDVSVLKQTYPDKIDQIHPAQKVAGNISQYYSGALNRLTSGEFGNSGYFMGPSISYNRANVTEYWRDPSKNYPRGLYVVLLNNEVVLHKGHLTYYDGENEETGRYYKNIVHIPCKRRTKNIHGRTPLDDVISKQVQRNKLESFIELIIFRMAAPHWLLPKDCGLDAISGEPGTSLTYNRVNASQTSVLKPEMISGIPPNPVLVQWLDKIDQDTEYVIGVTKVLMGQLPPGTPAARALEILMQRSRERHGDVFFSWNAGFAECINMLLKIVKQVRPVDLFKASKKLFGGFSMRVFEDEDFNLDLDIIPETEQPAPPRSTAAELELIKDFITSGTFQMPPNIQYEIFNRFGFDYLNRSYDSDKDYIARENFLLVRDGVVPVVKVYDNHPLHFEDHRIFLQSDEYADWAQNNPQLAQEFELHVAAHQNAMLNMQAQQAMPQGQPMPTDGAPQGAAPALM